MSKKKEVYIEVPEEFVKLGENFKNSVEKLVTALTPLMQSFHNSLERHGIKIKSDTHSSEKP